MTIGLKQAQLKLAELVEHAQPGDQVTIQRNGETVAEVAVPKKKRPRTPGFAKDIIRIIADDDEHLNDFKPYME